MKLKFIAGVVAALCVAQAHAYSSITVSSQGLAAASAAEASFLASLSGPYTTETFDSFLADTHISSAEGSIGAFPRRLQVAADDWPQARRVLGEAGLQSWLVADGEARP